jgi:hypothetical protein
MVTLSGTAFEPVSMSPPAVAASDVKQCARYLRKDKEMSSEKTNRSQATCARSNTTSEDGEVDA